jgi:hypothetical protein
MSNLRRVSALAIRFNWASKVRFILLTLIAAVGMTIFLIVSELSRISSKDLNESISMEVGQTGTYAIDFSTTLGMSADAMGARVEQALRSHASLPLIMIEILEGCGKDIVPGHAATRYSWMRPPRRSRRRILGHRDASVDHVGTVSGAFRSSPRCGLCRL